MRITAVVVNYGRASDTIACVESLRGDAPDVQAIVVDNGSAENDVSKLAVGLPEGATLLRAGKNLGYAGGNNYGIKHAMRGDPDAILILNNDVVVQPGCVAALANALVRHAGWGAAGPLSLLANDPGVVDFYTADVDVEHVAIRAQGRDGALDGVVEGETETDYLTGSAMLLRRTALERVGYFDERFFLVWEDVDLCLRLRRAGWSCGVTTDARVHHARSSSFGGDGSPLHRYYFVRNSFLIVRKHVAGFARLKAELLAVRRYAKGSAGGSPMSAAVRTGLLHGIAGRWGIAPAKMR